jgi:hypothetical protein
MLHLYTFILQLGEASSITQRVGSDMKTTFLAWLATLHDDVTILPESELCALRERLSGDDPVAVDGLRDVWYVNTSIASGHAQIHIVRTDRS